MKRRGCYSRVVWAGLRECPTLGPCGQTGGLGCSLWFMLHWVSVCGWGTPAHAGCLCSFQVVSASPEEPALAASGGGGVAGVSDTPASAGAGGRG